MDRRRFDPPRSLGVLRRFDGPGHCSRALRVPAACGLIETGRRDVLTLDLQRQARYPGAAAPAERKRP